MALECDGSTAAPKIACPLRCRRQGGAATGNAPASGHDQVDWAGLPVNLDLVFSRNQRDKVYVQHLLRQRGTQLWRWLNDSPQLCALGNECPLVNDGADATPENRAENREPDTVRAYLHSLGADERYYRDVS